ncbi:hypothetical protein [Arcticibacter tournemirensis]|uniref:Uncharacterized protein n=1 Tax=Arcticibacter tournemirensis TaxID=699437 RepID=A0A4Q0MDY1_9SPHI|nr:hypothetical protein [Arcticibacter tournemirensis]RXF71016.1 hypothetical protein EKH83_04710 [Arcticibacter tournemirensis]
MNKPILKLIMLFAPLYRRFGADALQLKVILETKLKMDDRRPLAVGRQKPGKESKYSTWITMIVLAMSGLFLAFFLPMAKQPYTGHTIYFSAFMVMLAVTLISDFTNVLIDVRDNYIILPKPVNDATFSLSRVLHILIHVSKMAFALSIAGLIYMLVMESILASLLFIVEILISTVLSIFIVNIVYLLVLKVSSPARFKDFISYFQVFFSVVIFALYYMLPRLIDSSVLKNIDILSFNGIYFLPSLWVASLHELSVASGAGSKIFLLATAAVISPFICLFLVVKVLAPGFNTKLGAISGSGNDEQPKQGVKSGTGFIDRIANAISPNAIENAGFRITWMLTSRFRDFRVKVYPSFAYVPVYFIYFAFINRRGEGSFASRWEEVKGGNMYLFLAYLTGFVLITVLQNVSYSDKYKASWIYFTTPHNQPGRILGGMFKAVVVKYYVPYFIFVSVFTLIFWGPRVINDMLLAFFVSLLYGLLNALFMVKGLPFSKPPVIKAGSRILISFLLIMIPGAIGFAHYWLSSYEILIWVAAFISGFLSWLAFHYYVRESWESLEMED